MFYHANNYFRKSNEFSLNLPIENGAWNKEIQVKFLCYGDIIIPEKLHFRIWLCYNCDRNEDNKKKREKKGDRLCQRHDFVTGVAVYHSRCYCFFPVRQLFYSTRTLKNGKNRPDLLETFWNTLFSKRTATHLLPSLDIDWTIWSCYWVFVEIWSLQNPCRSHCISFEWTALDRRTQKH